MKLTWLSNKGSAAPIFYLFLQGLLLGSLTLTCPTALDFNSNTFLFVFWFDVVVTIAFFFIVHRGDPGHVPVDGVFFTDQEEPPLSASNHHYNSMIKLRMADSRVIQSFELSPCAVEGQAKQNVFVSGKNQGGLSKLLKSTSNSTAITKQGDYNGTLNSPLPPHSKLEVENENENDEEKNESPEDDELHTRVEVCLSRVEDEEEGSQGEDDVEFQAAIGGDDDDDVPRPFVAGSFEQNELAPQIKRGNQDLPNCLLGNKNQSKFATGIMREYKGKYGPQLDDVEEVQEKNTTTNHHMDTRIQSQRANKMIKTQHSMEVDQSVIIPHQNEDPVHKPKNFGILSQQGGNIEFLTGREANTKSMNYFKPNDSVTQDIQIPNSSNIGVNINNSESKNSDSDKSKYTPGNEQPQQEGDQPETLYIERRYCTACNIDQPLRAKHCKECNRCTAQYDHHCPWIGTCIGEKNHLVFYFFLLFQGIEVLYGETMLIQRVVETYNKEWAFEDVWRVIALLCTTFFSVMVSCLFLFHSYLATQNLSTWEFLSWNKISYLKEWNPRWGSPFTQGMKQNLKFFFKFRKDLNRWKMPKYRAPLSQQDIIAASAK